MTESQLSAFVAYSGRDTDHASIIYNGVRKANVVTASTVRFEPWVFNDIVGNTLISPIIEGIDASPFVVADITYLNLNVVYEIGLSIGRRKKSAFNQEPFD